MAHIFWLTSFIIFSIAFMIFNMMNYNSFIPSTPKSSPINKMQSTNLLN